ncbi:MAG: hypothetical protein PF439_10255 [Helicobacteraceae bacterium]|jgi:hypothetical protein|nr:hypothetical protein [Helicobacteraceae bacterium]
MSELTKQSLLQSADTEAIINVIAGAWPRLSDEDEQEICLETVYDLLAATAPQPGNFNLLSNDDKAQYEIDVDMLLITIDFDDLRSLIFDDGENEYYFWSHVGDRSDKTNKKIYTALFN